MKHETDNVCTRKQYSSPQYPATPFCCCCCCCCCCYWKLSVRIIIAIVCWRTVVVVWRFFTTLTGLEIYPATSRIWFTCWTRWKQPLRTTPPLSSFSACEWRNVLSRGAREWRDVTSFTACEWRYVTSFSACKWHNVKSFNVTFCVCVWCNMTPFKLQTDIKGSNKRWYEWILNTYLSVCSSAITER